MHSDTVEEMMEVVSLHLNSLVPPSELSLNAFLEDAVAVPSRGDAFDDCAAPAGCRFQNFPDAKKRDDGFLARSRAF